MQGEAQLPALGGWPDTFPDRGGHGVVAKATQATAWPLTSLQSQPDPGARTDKGEPVGPTTEERRLGLIRPMGKNKPQAAKPQSLAENIAKGGQTAARWPPSEEQPGSAILYMT